MISSFLPPSTTFTDLARKLSPEEGLRPLPPPQVPFSFLRFQSTGMPMMDLFLLAPLHLVQVGGAAIAAEEGPATPPPARLRPKPG